MIAKVIKQTRPRAVLGISCEEEALLGILALGKYGIVAIGVLLTRDGCYNTAVDLEEALTILSLTKE
jgi:hypothetical protein